MNKSIKNSTTTRLAYQEGIQSINYLRHRLHTKTRTEAEDVDLLPNRSIVDFGHLNKSHLNPSLYYSSPIMPLTRTRTSLESMLHRVLTRPSYNARPVCNISLPATKRVKRAIPVLKGKVTPAAHDPTPHQSCTCVQYLIPQQPI